MGDIKLIRIKDGQEVVKSEVNWTNLDKKSKANYRLAGDNETGTATVTFSPPELGNKAKAAGDADKTNTGQAETTTGQPDTTTGQGPEVTQTPEELAKIAKVLELAKTGMANAEIAKQVGLSHHSQVRSIIAKATKAAGDADKK